MNRTNDLIRISPVRLIDHENVQRGIVPTAEALRIAHEAGLDLVEVSPQETPPVCRILDWGKQKYDQRKKQRRQHSHENVLKEVRLRPKTDDHDREIKLKKAMSFLEHGHKVQFTMLFRGRERAHADIALKAFDNIVNSLGETVKIEQPAKIMGRRMTMVLAPVKKLAPGKN